MSNPEQPPPLPIRAAGGGQASKFVTATSLSEFSAPVLKHLLAVHKTLPTHAPFQDGFQPNDEAAFLSYMASPSASAVSPPQIKDLSYPLSSYYISSSHNTYLSGHQLYGEATTEAYTNVLKRGCRCLEIDVWDGEDTDTSDDEENQGSGTSGRARSNSKQSRWDRMKTKATNRIRAHSGSSPSGQGHGVGSHFASALSHAHLDRSGHSNPSDPTRLSPQTSPNQPLQPEPRVLHGYTLTHSVSFRSVCQAIAEFAFTASSLPVIVSLEVHASLSQQEIMVAIMKEAWANHLVDITQSSESELESLPSPESLRNKILIKVKWAPNQQTGESNNPIEHVRSASTDETPDGGIHTTPSKQKKASKVIAALSELGIYTRAYTFKHFSQPEASIPTHVFSLSEGKVHDMHSDPQHGPALFDHNIHYLMRVFPKGTRISSSNVDPSFHWRQGAQMVALNWQKLDKGMMLNEGMFADQEGWVLKPEGYRPTRKADGETPKALARPSAKKQTLNLDITILAAQQLPLPLEKEPSHLAKMKPYVQIQLHTDTHGPPGQGKSGTATQAESDAFVAEEEKLEKKYKRKTHTAKSASPDFVGETLSWVNVSDVVDELSFLRLKVKDDHSIGSDDLIAWACIRLDRLRSGYRFIHLLDAQGLPSAGVVLVRVSKSFS